MVVTKEIEIKGKNKFDQPSKFREGCRGIIVKDGSILLSYFMKKDLWMIPGGGLEESESLRDCCRREVEEETSLIIQPSEDELICIKEYYEEWLFTSHYFVSTVVGQGKTNFTQTEIDGQMESHWVQLDEALDIFSHNSYSENISEEKIGTYQREYTALKFYSEQYCHKNRI